MSMTRDAAIAEFLGQLERREARLLTWGLVDGYFSDDELDQLAQDFLDQSQLWHEFVDAEDLLESLADGRLLFPFLAGTKWRYRTRMAETLRLLARLRQLFPKHLRGPQWRLAPTLVADFRFLLRPRAYPRRSVDSTQVLARLAGKELDQLQQSAIGSLLGGDRPMQLRDFQLRATQRILSGLGRRQASGTIICAGTGSGKTLAFYLPALVHLVGLVDNRPWVKGLAIYPRNELLKDQLAETYAQARQLDALLATHRGRKLRLGTLFSATPRHAQAFESNWPPVGWNRVSGGYLCPFMRCPGCQGEMFWHDSDRRQNMERLRCRKSECLGVVSGDELTLTRESLVREPPDILFTTTEMLNQRMGDTRFGRLFGIGQPAEFKPRMVLLDEVHTYSGPSGAHVGMLLRRWQHAAGCRPHFVGLSATLRDARRFFASLTGLGEEAVEEVGPRPAELDYQGMEYLVALRGDPAAGASLLSTTIQSAMLLRRTLEPPDARPSRGLYGGRIFLFTDDLDVTNRMFFNLRDAEGEDSWGNADPARPGGSLANLRNSTGPEPGARFALGQAWDLCRWIGHNLQPGRCMNVERVSSQDVGVSRDADQVVATAALEVGFNDPEVGGVLQHKAPRDPAQFLQRKGRAGRNPVMRPWTVVVLSDYGRDRLAYQSYDLLFDPELPARDLPLSNRHVLRIQAALATMDWLASRVPAQLPGSVWLDLSVPSEARPRNEQAIVRRRQQHLADLAEELLTREERCEELALYLQRALRIDSDDVQALVWEPPRAILTGVVPTLLRRLRTHWQRINSAGFTEAQGDFFVYNSPLPEFVPRALFEDLNVPEVMILTPPQQKGDEPRENPMRIVQAMQEFAPGRVSRRFGIRHRYARHWIAPPQLLGPPRQDLRLAEYVAHYEELGPFQIQDSAGVRSLRCVRPWRLQPVVPPPMVRDSTNAFLEWRTQLGPSDEGLAVDIPTPSRWNTMLGEMCFFTHNHHASVESRRFALGSRATILFEDGRQVETRLRFVDDEPSAATLAVGFAIDVDGFVIRLRLPDDLGARMSRLSEDAWRSLRADYFRHLVEKAEVLDGLANTFCRQWLAQIYLSALVYQAMDSNCSLEASGTRLADATSLAKLGRVLDVIFQSIPTLADAPDSIEADDISGERDGNLDDAAPGCDDASRRQRLHQQLLALLHDATVRNVLQRSAAVLWQAPDPSWHPWLRRKIMATIASGAVQTIQQLCPDLDARELLVDLDAGLRPPGSPAVPPGCEEIWITETSVGGGGIIERFLAHYGEDPRRFWDLVVRNLAPSEHELVDEQLTNFLAWLADSPRPQVVAAVQAFRVAHETSHEATVEAFDVLLDVLRTEGLRICHPLVAALHTRILRPGSSPSTDELLFIRLQQWRRHEANLGVEVDLRLFAYLCSNDGSLDVALQQLLEVAPTANLRQWRYSAMYSLLWPRGNVLRNARLRLTSPYDEMPTPEPELVLALLNDAPPVVSLDASDWFEQAASGLLHEGLCVLRGASTQVGELRQAVLRMTAEAQEVGVLLLYPGVRGVQHHNSSIDVEFELTEAMQ